MARRRIFLTFTALAVMAMILFFSTQNSRASEQTSGYLVDWLIDRFLPQFDVWPLARQLQTHQAWQFVVRKCAHFTEYALLGLALTPLVHSYGARRGWLWSWLLATALAALDETLQYLGGTRSGVARDVVLDSFGALCGAGVWMLLRRLRRHR